MLKYILSFFLLLFSPALLHTASLDEKIGQMLMIGFSGSDYENKWAKEIVAHVEDNELGGVLLFSRNITSPSQLKRLTSHLKKLKSKQPLFIAIDQEGGAVMRMDKKKGFEDYPSAFNVAKDLTLKQSKEIYTKMASSLSSHGININFAPVVDLNTNENSPIIGAKKRSFSAYEEIVIAYANEFIQAHEQEGVISVLKHFPGHGSSLEDSHKGVTDITKTWKYKELKPYYYFIKHKKASAVMVGHLYLKSFDKSNPASLSKQITTKLLRDELGYEGVVFSDDMLMGAITDEYGIQESIIKAINAGVDVLVFSSYFTQNSNVPRVFHNTVKKALRDGKISQARIDEAYKRILALKQAIR